MSITRNRIARMLLFVALCFSAKGNSQDSRVDFWTDYNFRVGQDTNNIAAYEENEIGLKYAKIHIPPEKAEYIVLLKEMLDKLDKRTRKLGPIVNQFGNPAKGKQLGSKMTSKLSGISSKKLTQTGKWAAAKNEWHAELLWVFIHKHIANSHFGHTLDPNSNVDAGIENKLSSSSIRKEVRIFFDWVPSEDTLYIFVSDAYDTLNSAPIDLKVPYFINARSLKYETEENKSYGGNFDIDEKEKKFKWGADISKTTKSSVDRMKLLLTNNTANLRIGNVEAIESEFGTNGLSSQLEIGIDAEFKSTVRVDAKQEIVTVDKSVCTSTKKVKFTGTISDKAAGIEELKIDSEEKCGIDQSQVPVKLTWHAKPTQVKNTGETLGNACKIKFVLNRESEDGIPSTAFFWPVLHIGQTYFIDVKPVGSGQSIEIHSRGIGTKTKQKKKLKIILD